LKTGLQEVLIKEGLSNESIMQFKAQNIDPAYIREVQNMGLKEKITPELIIQLKIFKIDKE
jgi:hypothetical protein